MPTHRQRPINVINVPPNSVVYIDSNNETNLAIRSGVPRRPRSRRAPGRMTRPSTRRSTTASRARRALPGRAPVRRSTARRTPLRRSQRTRRPTRAAPGL